MTPEEIATKLTRQQQEALVAIVGQGNNPYGWAASDLGVSGAAMRALERRWLLRGGHVYGVRQKTYILTDLSRSVEQIIAAAIRARGGHE